MASRSFGGASKQPCHPPAPAGVEAQQPAGPQLPGRRGLPRRSLSAPPSGRASPPSVSPSSCLPPPLPFRLHLIEPQPEPAGVLVLLRALAEHLVLWRALHGCDGFCSFPVPPRPGVGALVYVPGVEALTEAVAVQALNMSWPPITTEKHGQANKPAPNANKIRLLARCHRTCFSKTLYYCGPTPTSRSRSSLNSSGLGWLIFCGVWSTDTMQCPCA